MLVKVLTKVLLNVHMTQQVELVLLVSYCSTYQRNNVSGAILETRVLSATKTDCWLHCRQLKHHWNQNVDFSWTECCHLPRCKIG